MADNAFVMKLGEILENVSLFEVYMKYHTWIDFCIYLYVFTSVTWLVFPKFFGEKRSSRTLSQGMGIFLAVSAVVAENVAGFSIASFWPFAVIIFVAMIGLLAYHFLTIFKVQGFTAVSVIFFAAYLGLITYNPSIWTWFQKFPLVSGAITVAAGLSGILIFQKVIPPLFRNIAHVSREGGLDMAFATKAGSGKLREIVGDLQHHHKTQFRQEDVVITNRMKRISEEAEKDSEKIKASFLTVHNLCTSHKKQLVEDQNLRVRLFQMVQRVLPHEQHALYSKIAALGHEIKKIYRFDLQEIRAMSDKFHELKDKVIHTKVTEEDLANIKRVIHQEHVKHRWENRLSHLESELKDHAQRLQTITDDLMDAVGNADMAKAAKIAENGAEEAQNGLRLEAKTERLERKLDMFTKRIIRELDQLKQEVNVK